MTKEEALKRAAELQYLVGRQFQLPDREKETVKSVVAWEGPDGQWEPHVCFYDWSKPGNDGELSHLPVDRFREKYGIR